jgi:hypothetical protein
MKFSSYLPLLIILSAFLAAGIGAYVYALSDIATTAATEGELTNTAAAVAQRDSDVRSMVALLKETEADRTTLSGRVVRPDGVADFLDLIEKQGEVSVASVSLAQGGWDAHEIVRVTFTAEGSFGSLSSLLSRLESIPYAMHIERAYFEQTQKNWLASFTVAVIKEK